MSVRKVILAVSGGLDSAVAALLLKRKGYEVSGVFMRNWDIADEAGTCTAETDAEDAEFVCKKIGIRFTEVSFVKEYWNEVFTYVINAYQNAWTPNPDIMCNKKIKFDCFYNYALNELGGDAMATGHYARTNFGPYLERYNSTGDISLLRAVDGVKDQTFFLSQVPEEPLRRTMFPIGELFKENVRKIAVENGLERIAEKKESMGMCFIGSRNFPKFIGNYVEPKPGKFINVSTGRVEGDHDGVHLWVIGQRIRVPGLDKPRYVVRKYADSDLLVGSGEYHPALLSSMLMTGKPHWIGKPPNLDWYHDCGFVFQHVKSSVFCRLVSLKTGGLFVVLRKPLSQLNPGQFAVFYDENRCLGSAEIINLGPSYFSLGRETPRNYREYDELRLSG